MKLINSIGIFLILLISTIGNKIAPVLILNFINLIKHRKNKN
jgi:hypothetical protein